MDRLRIWANDAYCFVRENAGKTILFSLFGSILISCAESHSPNTEELITVRPPTISNTLNNGLLTTPTKNFILTGTCDPTGYGMQSQLDDGAWTDMSPGCTTSGTWSQQFSLIKVVRVSIRSKSKFKFTNPAVVTARFVLPPTSPTSTMVASSITQEENAYGRQSSIPAGIEGRPLSSGSHKLYFHSIGAAYGE